MTTDTVQFKMALLASEWQELLQDPQLGQSEPQLIAAMQQAFVKYGDDSWWIHGETEPIEPLIEGVMSQLASLENPTVSPAIPGESLTSQEISQLRQVELTEQRKFNWDWIKQQVDELVLKYEIETA